MNTVAVKKVRSVPKQVKIVNEVHRFCSAH